MDHRSNSEHHRASARAVARALPALRDALQEEDNLEWAGALREIIADVTHVHERLIFYADQAEVSNPR
jgi:hypothetical protein